MIIAKQHCAKTANTHVRLHYTFDSIHFIQAQITWFHSIFSKIYFGQTFNQTTKHSPKKGRQIVAQDSDNNLCVRQVSTACTSGEMPLYFMPTLNNAWLLDCFHGGEGRYKCLTCRPALCSFNCTVGLGLPL